MLSALNPVPRSAEEPGSPTSELMQNSAIRDSWQRNCGLDVNCNKKRIAVAFPLPFKFTI
jgi:hypothetical protein